jgi:hypothetical protein
MRSHRTAARGATLLTLLLIAVAATATSAEAMIRPIPKRTAAMPLARAVFDNPRLVSRSFFSLVPPLGNPGAVSTTKLAGFPRKGPSYAILSSGNARFADDKNKSGSRSGANLGPLVRGARDVIIWRTDFRVPQGANCLSLRFRFLSEEFPEFVHDIYNDAFIAELDNSTWDASGSSDPTINSPDNFATTAGGLPIRVNATGDSAVSASRAHGTTYDAATRLLRASTPVSAGTHSLYLSIFDQGDRQYDSSVFLDKLTLDRRSPCKSGAVVEGQ